MTPTYLTKKQVCEMLNISRSTIDDMRRKGMLRSYLLGGMVRIAMSDVLALLKESETALPNPTGKAGRRRKYGNTAD